jgi:hypothetical protein
MLIYEMSYTPITNTLQKIETVALVYVIFNYI